MLCSQDSVQLTHTQVTPTINLSVEIICKRGANLTGSFPRGVPSHHTKRGVLATAVSPLELSHLRGHAAIKHKSTDNPTFGQGKWCCCSYIMEFPDNLDQYCRPLCLSMAKMKRSTRVPHFLNFSIKTSSQDSRLNKAVLQSTLFTYCF